MIKYGLRVLVEDKADWPLGCASVWSALSAYATRQRRGFALSLCPNRAHAVLIGGKGKINWNDVSQSIAKFAQTSSLTLQCEEGFFETQVPLGIARLSSIRDEFRYSIFADLSRLMRSFPLDDLGRLLPVSQTFMLLDRLDWAGGRRLWPLSLNGQLTTLFQTNRAAGQLVHEVGEKVIPELVKWEQRCGVFRHNEALPKHLEHRLALLQRTYDDVRMCVADLSSVERDSLSENTVHLLSNVLADTHSAQDVYQIAIHPDHIAFRVFMSLLYDLGPLILVTQTRRLIAFHAIIETLRRDYPSLLRQANESGSQLMETSS